MSSISFRASARASRDKEGSSASSRATDSASCSTIACTSDEDSCRRGCRPLPRRPADDERRLRPLPLRGCSMMLSDTVSGVSRCGSGVSHKKCGGISATEHVVNNEKNIDGLQVWHPCTAGHARGLRLFQDCWGKSAPPFHKPDCEPDSVLECASGARRCLRPGRSGPTSGTPSSSVALS